MDRPEWIDTFPESLTAIAHADQQHRAAAPARTRRSTPPNPRAANAYGHIIQWSYREGLHRADLRLGHLRAGRRPGRSRRTARRSSATSTARPTASTSRRAAGCGSRPTSRAARSTPARTPGFGNNQMLCADPDTRETRRFLVGPNVCEITGVFVTPDERTMFVGIQHPGRGADGQPTTRRTRSVTARGPTAPRAAGRARRSSSSRRTTAARSAADLLEVGSRPATPPRGRGSLWPRPRISKGPQASRLRVVQRQAGAGARPARRARREVQGHRPPSGKERR